MAKEGKFSEKTYMYSFDIKSLFTAVPLEETINICAQALFDVKRYQTESDEKNFIKFLRLATISVEFSANGQMYKQLDGIAMANVQFNSTFKPTQMAN